MGQELIVMETNKFDEGRYYCKASNHFGNTSSSRVFVDIIGR